MQKSDVNLFQASFLDADFASANVSSAIEGTSAKKFSPTPASPDGAPTASYDESNIRTLDSLEHIRLRPGMYIGRLGDGSDPLDGIYVLMKEVIDNAIDEFVMKAGSRIDVVLVDGGITVRDYGRGIPHGSVVDCVSKMNTGGKFDKGAFQYSVGLNGVGTKAVNALSSFFCVTSWRDGMVTNAVFERGVLKETTTVATTEVDTGTEIVFVPDNDPTIFGNYSFNTEFIKAMLWNYSYLNPGLTISFSQGGKSTEIIRSKGGLKDLLLAKLGTREALYEPVRYSSAKGKVEIAFTHIANEYTKEDYYSYANGQYTSQGGTHQSYFKEVFARAVVDFFKKGWTADDVRAGLVAAIAVKVDEPKFDSQTKTRLTNTEIRADVTTAVRDAVTDFLLKNPPIAQSLSDKIVKTQKMNKEIAEVKKATKDATTRTAINVPKLKDCRYHLSDRSKKGSEEGQSSMIFICEGDSAAGSLTQTRDANHQAVFPVRGKVANMLGKKFSEVYKCEELCNLMKALGIEQSLDGLRYAKIIIATDADVDGFHIRNLLLTYFFSLFPGLIDEGRLFILETPLFRVRNKKVTRYCYSESERDEAVSEVPSADITRFKGLGEIDKREFEQFIGPDMKLVPVVQHTDITERLRFFMGDNNDARREFILANLR